MPIPLTVMAVLRRVGRDLLAAARRSDVMVVAAAMTCFAAFGVVPLMAIAVRAASGIYGPHRVVAAARDVGRYLHGPLGIETDVIAFARSASAASWWTVPLALLPVSLYAEGTVRSLERFSRTPERRSRALRGRLFTPVLVCLAVAVVVLLVGPLEPLLNHPFGRGTGARLLGIFLGFQLLFWPMFATLLVAYRLFASTRLRAGPLILGAFVGGSWIAGQLVGYSLALRFVGGFDNAFGRFAPAGKVAAIAFLVYLEHLVFLLGYLLALTLDERRPRDETADVAVAPAEGHPVASGATSRSTTAGRWSEASSRGVDVLMTDPTPVRSPRSRTWSSWTRGRGDG